MNDVELSRSVDEVASLLAAARDKEGNPLNLLEVMVSTRSASRTIASDAGDRRVDLRSVSKPILGLLFGALLQSEQAAQRGLRADTRVWPFFEGEIALDNEGNLQNLRELRIEHLLNSTVGHHDGIMFRKDVGDRPEGTLLHYAFNASLQHRPGTHFVYSNAGAFLLSALITRAFGRPADHLASESIFSPLGIDAVSWRHFGEDCAGCTGLKLNARELNQVGRAMLPGTPAGRSLATDSWRAAMLNSSYPTPTMTDEKRALPKRGYGHFLWKSREGHCYTDGTDGQYLIICGDRDTVITITGEQPDMKPIGEALRPLLKASAVR